MLPRRLKASGLHLLASASLAALAAALVFGVWYPAPYAALAGGSSLFLILTSVDVVLGPLLTAVVASPGKPMGELRRDIALIAVVQAVALGYGLHTLAQARPIYTVFEVDRLRVVSLPDIDEKALPEAAPAFRDPPWTGPRLIGARPVADPNKVLESIELSLKGLDLAMRPQQWAEYDTFRDAVIAKSRPAKDLITRYPQFESRLRALATAAGLEPGQLKFLPMVASRGTAIAVVSGVDARVLGYLEADPFF